MGKLIYLTITQLDITFVVSLISQFMHASKISHMDVVDRILRYLKLSSDEDLIVRRNGSHFRFSDSDQAGNVDDRRSATGYCTYIGENLTTQKNKKQNVVPRSSAESEYRAMAYTICELTWLTLLRQEFEL